MSTTHEDDSGPEQEATVHYLHAVREDTHTQQQTEAEEEPEVVEAELLTDAEAEELRRLSDPKLAALDRYQGYKNDLIRAGRGVRFVATHQHTKTTARFLARHGYFVTAGAWDMVCDGYKRATHRDIDERIAAAQRDGEHGTAAQLQQQKNESRKILLDKWRVFGMFLLRAPIGAGLISATVLIVTLVCSVVGLFQQGVDGFTSTWSAFGHAMVTGWEWVSFAGTTMLPAAAVLGLVGLVLTGYHRRRTRQDAPNWLQTAETGPSGAVRIDETAIAQALGALRLKPINDHLKEGLPLHYTVMPHRKRTPDGEDDVGVTAQVRIPRGGIAADVLDKKQRLAGNLGRAAVEVWPSVGEDEALLNLWVADRGSLDGGAGAWPWLSKTDPAELFSGVPIGKTLDGQPITAPVDGASYLVGGQPGQGKSMFTRALVAGACLDPRARIWVYVMADNNDFAPMRRRLERYEAGLGNDVIYAAQQGLHDIMAEIEKRGAYMSSHGYDTAAQAGYEPLVVAFDEIHRLFQFRDKKVRADVEAVAEDVAKLARKYGILVIYSTQSADAQSIPKGVTRQMQQRIAFSVIDQPANDALLGSGKYKQGVRATELRPGNEHYHGDRGKALTVGLVPAVDWAMCCGYKIDSDTLPELIDTAIEFQQQADISAANQEPQAMAQDRSLLADLDQVLGQHRIRLSELPPLLRDLDAHAQRYYDGLKAKPLGVQLNRLGVDTPAPQGTRHVDPDTVRRALAAQQAAEAAEADETDDEDQ
jgi:S-DNA-T family DNA segregation ATPase FtsK/SpoIIIE